MPPQGRAEMQPAGKAGPMPRSVKPMLATMVDRAFDRAGWVFEIKWDGFRAIAEVDRRNVRLYSRNFISLADRFPPVFEALRRLKRRAVLDGEIVCLDERGRSSFQRLQDYGREGCVLRYAVFDLLYLDGRDLRGLPLLMRKAILKKLVRGNPTLLY